MITVLCMITGVILGIISGLVPGLNIFITLTLLYPILLNLDPINIMVLFITMASIDQYFGSVSATVFATPGSTTSLPALDEGHELYKKGDGDKAIMFSAIGSFFASVFAVLMIIAMIPVVSWLYTMFSTYVQVVVLVLASVCIVSFSQNKIWVSVILFGVGNLLAHIGYRDELNTTFGTFGIDYLYSGVPMMPVIVALFVFPLMLRSMNASDIVFRGVSVSGYIQTLKDMKKYTGTLIRSSFIGSLAGFVPGITYGLSTVLAYSYEKTSEIKKKRYQKGNLRCLLAAETSNNAGVYTQLVPLLFIGIPITASEALIFNILEFRGFDVGVQFFSDMFIPVTIAFLISSFIGLLVAGKYVNFLKFVSKINIKVVYIVVFFLLCVATFMVGAQFFAGIPHLLMLIILLPVGYLLKSTDNIPLIYGFVLHEIMFSTITRVFYLI